MNTGDPNFGKRKRDPDLVELVEEYLSENWQLSYISIEDMIEKLQSRSFRYSRMKKQAFAGLVHRAYEDYCRRKTANSSQGQESSSQSVNTLPSQRPIQNIDVSSDSDIEIEEQSTKSSHTSSMPIVYSTSSKSSGSQITYLNKTQVINQTSTPKKRREERERSPSLLSSSPTPVAEMTNVLPPQSFAPRSEASGVIPRLNGSTVADKTSTDSDNDLEIIEEVAADKSVISSSGSEHQSPRIAAARNVPQNIPSQLTVSLTSVNDAGGRVGNKGHSQIQMPLRPEQTLTDKLNKVKETSRNSSISEDVESRRGVKRKPDKNEIEKVESNPKKLKREMTVTRNSSYKLEDFAGSENILEEICKLLMHLKHPEVYKCLGVTPPRGFLLHGPPGCGKTLLANAIAGELGMPMLKMAATELISGVSGESESNIRDLFNQALSLAPCIVFIDEIDAITPKRETAQREMERRIVAQLLACIDDLATKEKGDQVLLIGATNRIEAIDTGLRRAGRFDREICLGIPDVRAREKIIRVISRGLRLPTNFDFELLAKLTPGYVGADLQALTREAAVQAVNKALTKLDILVNQTDNLKENDVDNDMDITEIIQPNLVPITSGKLTSLIDKTDTQNNLNESPLRWIKDMAPLSQSQLDGLYMKMEDFVGALKNVQPSSKREGFATVPDITWDDIGALQDIRDELQVAILGPVKHASAFLALGLNTPAGSLLCGPPGVGKTLLAKAVANEAGINFISVKGPELLNMYVGESERAVRQCFLRARNSAPCVIFFDELDALCPRRSEVAESGSGSRIVNQLLTEMDGMESRLGVFVMAATNRPDIIDPAVLRPGRLEKIFFVDFPSAKDRLEILKAITKKGTKPVLDEDVNLEEISDNDLCSNYTGADLAALVREASIAAFRELILNNVDCAQHKPNNENKVDLKVSKRHFEYAFTRTRPSVSKSEREKYEKMKVKFSSLGGAKPLFLSGNAKAVEPASTKNIIPVNEKDIRSCGNGNGNILACNGNVVKSAVEENANSTVEKSVNSTIEENVNSTIEENVNSTIEETVNSIMEENVNSTGENGKSTGAVKVKSASEEHVNPPGDDKIKISGDVGVEISDEEHVKSSCEAINTAGNSVPENIQSNEGENAMLGIEETTLPDNKENVLLAEKDNIITDDLKNSSPVKSSVPSL